MIARSIHLVVLVAVLLQALFGGLDGAIGFCLGHGHDHESREVALACESSCDHGSDFALVVSGNDPTHDERCPCTDVELELTDLLVSARDVRVVIDVTTALLPGCSWTPMAAPLEPRLYDAPMRDDDPGGLHRLTIVRTTRLLI